MSREQRCGCRKEKFRAAFAEVESESRARQAGRRRGRHAAKGAGADRTAAIEQDSLVWLVAAQQGQHGELWLSAATAHRRSVRSAARSIRICCVGETRRSRGNFRRLKTIFEREQRRHAEVIADRGEPHPCLVGAGRGQRRRHRGHQQEEDRPDPGQATRIRQTLDIRLRMFETREPRDQRFASGSRACGRKTRPVPGSRTPEAGTAMSLAT